MSGVESGSKEELCEPGVEGGISILNHDVQNDVSSGEWRAGTGGLLAGEFALCLVDGNKSEPNEL